MGNGALVSIANKYGETPIDKAKTPLREVLKGRRFSSQPHRLPLAPAAAPALGVSQLSACAAKLLVPPERAEKLGQSLTKIPYKDTFWKGTTRTRPSKDRAFAKGMPLQGEHSSPARWGRPLGKGRQAALHMAPSGGGNPLTEGGSSRE